MKYTAMCADFRWVRQTRANFVGAVSSLSGSETESENEDEAGTSETGSSLNDQTKSEPGSKNDSVPASDKSDKRERRSKAIEFVSDSSDTECNEETFKKKKLQALLTIASRHSKVFFENEDGNIFSIYRCLLHHKKVSYHRPDYFAIILQFSSSSRV